VQGMFKKTTIAVTVTLTLSVALIARGGGGSSGSDAPLPPSVNLSELRSVTPLMQKWLFVQDDALSDAQALANDGSNWSTVTLPHTWNSKDAATTAQSTRSTPTYKRGLGWYRLAFDYSGKAATQWLQFDAASIAADVWLNGEKLGQHQGAFTAFRFNVTGKLKATNNVLVVKTDNRSARAATDPTAVEPLGGDFNVSGGLYRGVSLISTPSAAHFALDDFGSTGIFARTTSLSGVNANVNVLAKLKNDSKTDGRFTVQATLLEADGTTIKQAVRSTAVTVKAGAAASVAQDLAVSHAHLWNGLADPYLYRLVVELKDSNGASVDKVVQNFGIRQMTFDPNKGFSLNGKSMPLHGVNQHQDMLGKAWAITPADTDLSFSFIKEIGANTVRLAHYPHADYTYEQADKLGLVVWAENPLVNSTTVGSGVDPEITGFAANARQQLTELIRQRYRTGLAEESERDGQGRRSGAHHDAGQPGYAQRRHRPTR
jgi:beta-galactosidase